MKLVCIDNIGRNHLTIGRVYSLVETSWWANDSKMYYYIVDNNDKYRFELRERFISLDESRDRKIEEICH